MTSKLLLDDIKKATEFTSVVITQSWYSYWDWNISITGNYYRWVHKHETS